jgi:hypothetical protein
MLKLIIQSATKTIFGIYEIFVRINGKPYNYELYSKYSYDLMMSHYRAGRYTNCLAVLNKHKEKT